MVRTGPHCYYKGQYFIAFYDMNDRNLLYTFDNAREILKFLGKPITQSSVKNIDVILYRALKRKDNSTRLLGQKMKVYIIDILDD